jgi:hypothetical protein
VSISDFELSVSVFTICAVKCRLSGAVLSIVSRDSNDLFCDLALQLEKNAMINEIAIALQNQVNEKSWGVGRVMKRLCMVPVCRHHWYAIATLSKGQLSF